MQIINLHKLISDSWDLLTKYSLFSRAHCWCWQCPAPLRGQLLSGMPGPFIFTDQLPVQMCWANGCSLLCTLDFLRVVFISGLLFCKPYIHFLSGLTGYFRVLMSSSLWSIVDWDESVVLIQRQQSRPDWVPRKLPSFTSQPHLDWYKW